MHGSIPVSLNGFFDVESEPDDGGSPVNSRVPALMASLEGKTKKNGSNGGLEASASPRSRRKSASKRGLTKRKSKKKKGTKSPVSASMGEQEGEKEEESSWWWWFSSPAPAPAPPSPPFVALAVSLDEDPSRDSLDEVPLARYESPASDESRTSPSNKESGDDLEALDSSFSGRPFCVGGDDASCGASCFPVQDVSCTDVYTLPEIVSFEEWEAVFRKPGTKNAYATADLRLQKRAVFEATVRRIKQRKSNGASGRIGVNQFSDLTPEEFWALADVSNDEPAAKPNFFCLGSTLCVT